MGENISTRVAYGKALVEFGAREDIYVFDADLKKCTMTEYFEEAYPERFFNIGSSDVNEVIADSDKPAGRYNLQGQPVGNDYRGIVIENGRKILVK